MSRFAQLAQQVNALPVIPQRRGLFSGVRNFAQQAQQPGGFVDRLGMFGAQMQDIGQLDGVNRAGRLSDRRKEAEEAQARAQALAQLNSAFGGGASQGGGMSAQGGGVSGQGGGLPSLRQMGPALIAAQQAGLPIGDYISLLDKTGPDMQVDAASGNSYDARGNVPNRFARPSVINGRIVDTGDPRNLERSIPQIPEGSELLYDSQNNPVIRPIQGYMGMRGQLAGAVAGATAQAQTPFQLDTVQGPDGRPITASRASILGSGPIYGQSDADRQYGVATATNRAQADESRRVAGSAASRMIPTLHSMEQRLPDVIAGIGSGGRRIGNQVLGAMGVDSAQARVTATETYENEARQIVREIIQSFGTNPTEGERKYAEQMSGADVNYTPDTLQEGARLMRSRAARDIDAAGGTSQGLGDVVEDSSGRRLIWNGFDWVPL